MPNGIEASGFKEAIKAAKAAGDVERSRAYKQASAQIADLVVRNARAGASSRMERRAADDALTALTRGAVPAVKLSPSSFPAALGAEFGANRNQVRLLKNTRGRATVVRGDVERTRRRVEAQTVQYDRFGAPATVRKRARDFGATAVQVRGRITGWNQFKPWRGSGSNAGYFLWPAIRSSADEIQKLMLDAVEETWKTGE